MGFSTEGFLEEAARFQTCVAQVGTGWTDNKKASVVPRGPEAQGSPHSAVYQVQGLGQLRNLLEPQCHSL